MNEIMSQIAEALAATGFNAVHQDGDVRITTPIRKWRYTPTGHLTRIEPDHGPDGSDEDKEYTVQFVRPGSGDVESTAGAIARYVIDHTLDAGQDLFAKIVDDVHGLRCHGIYPGDRLPDDDRDYLAIERPWNGRCLRNPKALLMVGTWLKGFRLLGPYESHEKAEEQAKSCGRNVTLIIPIQEDDSW